MTNLERALAPPSRLFLWWRARGQWIALVVVLAIAGGLLGMWGNTYYLPWIQGRIAQKAAVAAEIAARPVALAENKRWILARYASVSRGVNEGSTEDPSALTAKLEGEAVIFRFEPGDTATGRFGKDAQQFCVYNKIANCNNVRANFDYVQPYGVTPRAVKPVVTKSATTARVSKPNIKTVREQSCINLGAAPFNRYGTLKLRLEGIDLNPELTPEEKVEAKAKVTSEVGSKRLVTADMVFPAMPFRSKDGTVKFKRNVKVCTPEQGGRPEALATWKLSTGTVIGDFPTCGNIGPVRLPPEEPIAPTPGVEPAPTPEPLAPTPQSTPEEPEPQPTPTPPVVAAPRGMCDHLDPSAVIGQEHEPRQNGADSHSTFATASLYCLEPFQTADSKTGVHGFGGKATYSEWHGSVNNGAGHYRGWNTLVGPSYKRIMDEGYDWEFSVGAGKQVETFRQAAYASRREFDLVGITAGHNDYRRRLAGETWDVERQYFGALTLPVGKKVGHTIFGQTIADTAELGRFNFGLQAGARWWFYENTDEFPLLPYLQGGVFVQHPTSASMSLRLGVADPDRICGVGIGIDQDLMHGGDPVAAWGWWCDLIKGGQVVRTKVRKHQVITEAASRGVTIEERGGFIQTIRFGEPPK